MDGIKRADMIMGSPIAKVGNGPDDRARGNIGAGNIGAGNIGRGDAVSPRGVVKAPDPITVPATREPAAVAPMVKARQLEFRGLVKDMASAPPVDMSRVMALQARISSGTFTIDPSRVADAMLGSLRAG